MRFLNDPSYLQNTKNYININLKFIDLKEESLN